VDFAGTLIFQPCEFFLHLRVDFRWFALGRKEIVMSFYLYAIIELLTFFLDSNIFPTAKASYPVSPGTVLYSDLSDECLDGLLSPQHQQDDGGLWGVHDRHRPRAFPLTTTTRLRVMCPPQCHNATTMTRYEACAHGVAGYSRGA
jgi:hypothetical protein